MLVVVQESEVASGLHVMQSTMVIRLPCDRDKGARSSDQINVTVGKIADRHGNGLQGCHGHDSELSHAGNTSILGTMPSSDWPITENRGH